MFELNLDDNFKFASIDQNVDNLAIALYNGESYLYSLKRLKSENRYWNKRVAKIQSTIDILKNENAELKALTKSWLTYENLTKQKYEESLKQIERNKILIKKLINKRKKITTRRNSFVENFVHQLSRKLVNQLSELKVNNIIYGKNVATHFKKEINLGKVNNQNFVQIPFNKIIDKISYKARLANINFMTVEESYTSKTSFLDKEKLFSYKNKPTQKEKDKVLLGKRIKRGLFRTQKGYIIHADVKRSGALNIARSEAVLGEYIYQMVDIGSYMGSSPKKVRINLN